MTDRLTVAGSPRGDAVAPRGVLVQPDAEFIEGVLESGGHDLKKCFQCATCVSVCTLADADHDFPRPQVVKAQWGMKEQLVGDPGVWLCHNCGECTERCPRGARPGDILGAIRSQVIRALAFPRFMGELAANSYSMYVLIFGVPIIVLALLGVFPLRTQPGRPMEFADLFPQARLEALFFTVSALVLLAFAVGATRLVRALRASGASGPIVPALPAVLVHIVLHRSFRDCSTHSARCWGHLLTFFGFLGMGIMGTVVGVGSLLGVMHTPLPLLHPLKLFANLCALDILAGTVLLLVSRIGDAEVRRASTYFDWLFLVMLSSVVFTGTLSEILRLVQNEVWMFTVYFVHLVLIFALFLYAPYSKFAHFLYRTIAMAATWKGEKRLPAVENCKLAAAAGANQGS
jgi:quinone-modifying oxidoreductase subunit QmoC